MGDEVQGKTSRVRSFKAKILRTFLSHIRKANSLSSANGLAVARLCYTGTSQKRGRWSTAHVGNCLVLGSSAACVAQATCLS